MLFNFASAAGPQVCNYLPVASESRTGHTANLDSCWRPFYLVIGTQAHTCESTFNCTL